MISIAVKAGSLSVTGRRQSAGVDGLPLQETAEIVQPRLAPTKVMELPTMKRAESVEEPGKGEKKYLYKTDDPEPHS